MLSRVRLFSAPIILNSRKYHFLNFSSQSKSLIQVIRKHCYTYKYAASSSASETAVTVSKNEKQVAYWLLGMAGLVAGMVTVGGITRLTRSGLSMTDWKLQGSLPPISRVQWEEEFDRYKKFPEWQQRQSMTLDEFKIIYFWEYGHRMMGRFLGVAFAIPAGYFAYRRMIPSHLYPRLALLFGLGGIQGLIGWWMVRSGLEIDPRDAHKRNEIRVSPYRLATHLGFAFTTYTLLLWTALDLLNPRSLIENALRSVPHRLTTAAKGLRIHAAANMALVATTVISGAYVAGNNAGRAFGTFPTMNGEWIPSGILEMTPVWRNFVENTATVQFDHRVLALTSLASITAIFVRARFGFSGDLWRLIPFTSQNGVYASVLVAWAQVGLGISTLLLCVPVPLAAVHQAGSLVLLTCATYLTHSLRFASWLPIAASASAMSTAAITRSIPQAAVAAGVSGAMDASAVFTNVGGAAARRHMSTVLSRAKWGSGGHP